MTDPRYPVGRFTWPEAVTAADREGWVERIASMPARFREAVLACSPAQIDAPYRPGGWTVRQVVHHVPDSHMHAYIRTKFALTEDNPVIKPYDEAACAELSDVRNTPIETSLRMLELLHERWVILLRSFTESDWKRQFVHPELGPVSLERLAALYAWHGDHHLGHVLTVLNR